MKKSRTLRFMFIATISVALFLGIFGIARIRAHGDDAGLIHACVNRSGLLRLEPPGGCHRGWTPIHLDEDWIGAGTGLMTPGNETDRVAIGTDDQNNGRLTVNADSDEEGLRVRNGGTTSFVVDDEGQVGVGTSNPVARLQVHSREDEDPLAVRLFGQTLPDFLVNADGNVGIGVSQPTDQLAVLENDDGRAGSFQIDNSGNGSAALSAVTNGQGPAFFANVLNPNNSGPAMWVIHQGLGTAARFEGHVEIQDGNLSVSGGPGSVSLLLEADTDNIDEDHQPHLTLTQDGGAITGSLGYFRGTNDLTLVNNNAAGTSILLEDDGTICIGNC